MTRLQDIEILHNLLAIPSPSGFEKNLAEYIQDVLLKFVDPKYITIDFQHNVIVDIPGKTDRTVLLDAHLDEIGFIITNVDKFGKISLSYIGGGDSTIVSARNLQILTKNGIVNAVVDRKHSHLVWDEDSENIYQIHQAEVDIGSKSKEEILKKLKIGDPVVYEPCFRQLTGDFYSGYGFDDKSGCFLLIKTLEQVIKTTPECRTIFVFSAQEETGNSKLIPVVRKYKPSLVVEADVTFATDYGEIEDMEAECGRCVLGEGVVLYRGVDIDTNGVELMERIATRNKIPYQIQAGFGRIGYTSLEVTGEADGVRAMVMGIPLRNMHAPTEVINYKDLISGAKLLSKFIVSKQLPKIFE